MTVNKLNTFIGVIFIVAISNMPICFGLIEFFCFQNEPYRYSNADGTFTVECYHQPKMPRNPSFHYLSLHESVIEGEEPKGKELRRLYPNADTVVYRLFWKNPLCFWRWYYYFTNELEEYDFPYKSWNEIKKRRPKNFVINERWQQF